MNDARRATSNPTAQAQIRSCLLFMRHGYEADRQQLTARIAVLEKELDKARRIMSKPDKTLKVGGNAEVTVQGDKLTIAPSGGLIVVSVFDLSGIVLWIHHPLAGWYIESDGRNHQPTERANEP